MRVTLHGCLLALAACGDSPGGDSPAPNDAAASLDALPFSDAPSQAGLMVSWAAMPPIPGTFATNVMVRSLKLRLGRIEIVGDGPGMVERSGVDVVWSQATGQPSDIFFDAGPALYSTISLTIDGMVTDPSYEILGTWNNNGTVEEFRISDTGPLDVDVGGYSVQLMPLRSETMRVEVDLESALNAVDFATLPVSNSVRTLDQTNGVAIAPVRIELRDNVFKRDN